MTRALCYGLGALVALFAIHGCGGDDEIVRRLAEQQKELEELKAAQGRRLASHESAGPYPGLVPGVAMGGSKPKVILGIDTNYPPYAQLSGLHLGGYGVDFVNLMNSMCNLHIEVTQVSWSECNFDLPPKYTTAEGYAFLAEAGSATNGGTVAKTMPGSGIQGGEVHGCMTYTHLFGARERIFEFSHAWTKAASKAAGLITRLVNGKPVISPTSTLTGVKVVDVTGFAPTAELVGAAPNDCVSGKPMFDLGGITFVSPAGDGNFEAMKTLKAGDADVLWVYAEQAEDCMADLTAQGCENWGGFGTEYAFIHMGLIVQNNGTTVAMSKKGSGLGEVLNPCIKTVLATQEYQQLCQTGGHPVDMKCFENSFFGTTSATMSIYATMQSARTDTKTCSDGYCTCSELP
jgi:hypothetical protein